MPTASHGDVTLRYELDGAGEAVVFLNDAGFGAWSWGWQHAALAGPFRTLVFDPRGVGESTARPPYDPATLAADCEAVCRAAGLRRVHLVGSGLGGMVALAHAHEYGRARSLALFGTALSGARVDDDALDTMLGPDALTVCLTERFRAAQPEVVAGITEWRRTDDAPRAVRERQADAMRAFALDAPYEVTLPTLVCHGEADPVVPVAAGRELADALPRGEFTELPGAHLPQVEASKAANDVLAGFLERVTDGDD